VGRAWRWAALALAVLATLGTLLKFRPEIERMRSLEARARDLEEEVARWEQRLAASAAEHRRMTDSPAYREALARDVLDLQLPGETVFRPRDAP
jgi:cell division protein FtsB